MVFIKIAGIRAKFRPKDLILIKKKKKKTLNRNNT